MAENVQKARMQQKRDLTTNWAAAPNFVPKSGEIIIYGDMTGDGRVTALDAIRLNRYTIGTGALSGCYLLAADANRDGKITTLDAIIVNRYTIGLSTIEQK